MRKIFIICSIIFLLTFSAVSAQNIADNEIELSFYTIGDILSWKTSAEEIYNIFSKNEIYEITVEQDPKYISAASENEDGRFFYVFSFDNNTEELWKVECFAVFMDGDMVYSAFQNIYESYNFENAEAYENDVLLDYASDFDSAYIATGEDTIAILAGSEETDEYYSKVDLVLINRHYFEN